MKRILFFCLWISFILTVGCSQKIAISPNAENLLVFPKPPDKTKIQFLTFINNSSDIERPDKWAKRFFIGEKKPKPIVRPYGIVVNGDKIFVCDPEIRGLEIINLKEKSFEYFIPTGIGELQMPLNCFVDSNKNIYIADSYRKQIVVFDKNLKYLNAFGKTENFKPIDVFVENDKIFVANLEGSCFDIFDKKTFKLLNSYPKISKGDDGFLYKPTSIYVKDSEVYLTDFGEGKIKVYDLEGNFLQSIGSYGRQIGQFVRPKEINFDRSGNLYVVDAAFENTQIFNNKGELLMYFGRPNNMNLPVGVEFSYDNLETFQDYVYKDYDLKFLIFVTNQFGSNKIGVYGFVGE